MFSTGLEETTDNLLEVRCFSKVRQQAQHKMAQFRFPFLATPTFLKSFLSCHYQLLELSE